MAAPMQIASLFVAIGADMTGLSAGLTGARGQLGGFQTQMASIGTSMTRIGMGLTAAVTLPIVGLGVSVLKTAAEFEAATNIMAVAARQSGTPIEELRQGALAVGKDVQLIGIDAMEAADAMTTFYKAGFTTSEIMGDLNSYLEEGTNLTGALRASIDLAAASDINLAQASDLVAISMATYGVGAEDATRIADAFVAGADASIAEVGGLADAMANIGPIAAAANMDLDTTVTLLAMLSEKGILGSEAGTKLKSMLTYMRQDTKETQEAWTALGVSMYDAEGNIRAIPDVLRDLQGALYGQITTTQTVGGVTAEQTKEMKEYASKVKSAQTQLTEYEAGLRGTGQTEATRNRRMKELTDTISYYTSRLDGMNIAQERTITSTRDLTDQERDRYIKALGGAYGQVALTALITEEGFAYEEMAEKMGTAASAQDVAEERTKGLLGALEQLQGAWQVFKIEAGDPYLEKTITPIVQGATELVNVLSELSPEAIGSIVTVLGGLALGGPIMLGLGAIIKSLAVMPGWLLLAAGGAALLGGVLLLGSEKGKEFTDSLWKMDEAAFAIGGREGLLKWISMRQGAAGAQATAGGVVTGAGTPESQQAAADLFGYPAKGETFAEKIDMWGRETFGSGGDDVGVVGEWLYDKIGPPGETFVDKIDMWGQETLDPDGAVGEWLYDKIGPPGETFADRIDEFGQRMFGSGGDVGVVGEAIYDVFGRPRVEAAGGVAAGISRIGGEVGGVEAQPAINIPLIMNAATLTPGLQALFGEELNVPFLLTPAQTADEVLALADAILPAEGSLRRGVILDVRPDRAQIESSANEIAAAWAAAVHARLATVKVKARAAVDDFEQLLWSESQAQGVTP